MKIGIYKAYKELFFDDSENDTNGWSLENVNLLKIFANHGHKIKILSKTDYKNDIRNIEIGNIMESNIDILLVSNGVFEKDKYTEDFILNQYKKSKKILLETDLQLSIQFHNINKYDLILTQMPDTEKRKYAHLEKLILYNHPIYNDDFNSRLKQGIFVGFERDRSNKFKEYVINTDINFRGKSETLKIDSKVNRKRLSELLRKYIYSPVFSGELQNKNNFVAQRYYENCLHGTINFIDYKYDGAELLIKKNDWRRVANGDELLDKSKKLDYSLFKILQQNQFQEIKQWIDGTKLYNHIYNLIK